MKCLKCDKKGVHEDHGFCDDCESKLKVRKSYLKNIGALK